MTNNTEPVVTDADRELASQWVFSPHQVLNCAKDIAALRQAAVAKREAEIVGIIEQWKKHTSNGYVYDAITKILKEIQTGGGA